MSCMEKRKVSHRDICNYAMKTFKRAFAEGFYGGERKQYTTLIF